MSLRARFRVTGRVQGVGFRWWAEAQAQALGLAGFVRNEPDGAVSGEAAGPPEALAAFRDRLAEGPSSARVADLAWDLEAGMEVEVDGGDGSGAHSLPFPFAILR